MARVDGVKPGYAPPPAPKRPRPKKKPDVRTCHYCDGEIKPRQKRFEVETDEEGFDEGDVFCLPCHRFFQLSIGDPICPFSPEVARDRVARADETQWILVLKTQPFFGVETGQTFTVEMGDVFKVKRAGLVDGSQSCSARRSKERFTVTISVGQNDLVLFPHEFAPISWLEVMRMIDDGDMTEQYIEANDDHGYFAPVDEVRAAIRATFGG